MYVAGFRVGSMDHLSVERRSNILLGLCEALAYINYQWLEERGAVPLYQIAPRYDLKVRPFSIDFWDDIPTVVANGGGDCKDFVAWRVAELRKQGIGQAVPYVTHTITRNPNGRGAIVVWHVQVAVGPQIEDPATLLGMPDSVDYQALSRLFR